MTPSFISHPPPPSSSRPSALPFSTSSRLASPLLSFLYDDIIQSYPIPITAQHSTAHPLHSTPLPSHAIPSRIPFPHLPYDPLTHSALFLPIPSLTFRPLLPHPYLPSSTLPRFLLPSPLFPFSSLLPSHPIRSTRSSHVPSGCLTPASATLTPARVQLARGELSCVGATTMAEYRHIEKDAALARRFQPIVVSEPSVQERFFVFSILTLLPFGPAVRQSVRL